MTFLEKKKNKGFSTQYHYKCIDVFGELNIKSFSKLNADILDLIVMKALKDTPNGCMKGISWELKRTNAWEEIEKESVYSAKVIFRKHFSFNFRKIWAFLKKIVNA